MNVIRFEDTGGKKKVSFAIEAKEINLAYTESQQIFRRLVEKARSGIFMTDVNGILFYVNQVFVDMTGYEGKDHIMGLSLAEALFTDLEKRSDFLKKMNQLGVVYDYEIDVKRQDGLDVVLSVTCSTLEDKDGKIIGLEGFVHDVTRQSEMDEALLTEKQKLEQILEFNDVVSRIKEFNELVETVVRRVARLLGAQKCSLMLMDEKKQYLTVKGAVGISEAVVKEARLKIGEPIAGAVAGEGHPVLVRNIEYDKRFKRANRPSYFGRSFMIVPLRLGLKVIGVINVADKKLKKGFKKGSKLNYEEAFSEIDLKILISISREVSVALDNVKLFEELNALAVTDPLVHIYNYRQFSKSLDYEIKRAKRSKHPLCIAMIDVDDFKSYNDTFGHPAGDALLQNLGRIFEEQLREVDIICRYAGDEFTIIFPNTDPRGAGKAAEKILKAVQSFKFKKDVTLSIGIAAYHDELTQYQLIAEADKALYESKRLGKNRVSVSGQQN